MILDQVKCWKYRIPLQTPLVNSRGTISSREGVIICGHSDKGHLGLGEAAPLPGFSQESVDEVLGLLPAICEFLRGREIPSLPAKMQSTVDELCQHVTKLPSIIFAVETLLADLASQKQSLPLCRWLSSSAELHVPVNAILSGTMTDVLRQAKSKKQAGYRTFKLKVGVVKAIDELELIKKLRECLGEDASIRLDANEAFDFETASAFLRAVKQFDIEYIEDPLRKEDFYRLVRLKKECGIDIALDESATSVIIGGASVCDVVVMKPTVIGGMTRCRELSETAVSKGIKVVISSAIETGIGVTALLHLAASLPQNRLACGLDTLGLLSDPLVDGPPVVDDGFMLVPFGPGLGVTIPDLENNHLLELVCR